MKHIGILAHSVEGSALCYLATCHEGSRRLGAHMHPDITLHMVAMGKAMDAWETGNLQAIRKILFDTVGRLAAAGCDFFICPDNTAHLALEAPGESFPLPGLHIARIVAEKARAAGYAKIGVLGTKWTMEGPLYGDAFDGLGCQSMIPGGKDMELVDRVIFDQLCNGIISDRSRQDYIRIISQFRDQNCDAVVLGCTEIPLLITADISPLPCLDSTRLLAISAIDVALDERPGPSWRGGPFSSP